MIKVRYLGSKAQGEEEGGRPLLFSIGILLCPVPGLYSELSALA